jgi:hypothetical protein
MSSWRLGIGIVLILHGLGHVLGVIALTSLGGDNWNARSWLLTDSIGDGPARVLSAVLWVACCVAFVVAGLALLEIGFPEDWWKPIAASAAFVSLVTLTVFWNAFPVLFPNKIGAIAVNLAAIWGVLLADWPTEHMLNR